jgi:hypothetical protein
MLPVIVLPQRRRRFIENSKDFSFSAIANYSQLDMLRLKVEVTDGR